MMKAGTYYVGDLCYVLHEDWDEVCSLIIDNENRCCLDGEFNLKDGRRFAVYSTAYGNGTYCDQNGRKYSVDAGIIGCILLDDVDLNAVRNDIDGGNIIKFAKEFYTSSDGQNIKIGNVTVYTGNSYDEDGWGNDD